MLKTVDRKSLWVVPFLALLAFLLYANSLGVPFYFDDKANIEKNIFIQLHDFSIPAFIAAVKNGLLVNRPVANASFVLDYYFYGHAVAGYHLVNIGIHAATGIFLFLLFQLTLRLAAPTKPSTQSTAIAALAAMAWLAHPVQVQSVTYIVQRMNSMAAMFYILSMYCYVRGRISAGTQSRFLWLGGMALSFAGAMGSKEIAATLPFFILLYEWYFFRDLARRWLRRNLLVLVACLALAGLLVLVYIGRNPMAAILNGYAARQFTLSERLLTEFRVVVFYLSLLFFPHPFRLNLEHDFSVSTTFASPLSTLFSLLLIAGLLITAVRLARRQRLLSFCILWFLGNLVIESSVIGLELVFEHRLYLPSMFAMLLLVVLMAKLARNPAVLAGVLAVVILLFGVLTVQRNMQWQDPVVFWQDCLAKSPGKVRIYNNLGKALYDQGRMEEAISVFQAALRLDPLYALSHNNIGLAYLETGNSQAAISHLQQAILIDQSIVEAHNNLGNIFARQGQFELANRYFKKALQLNPDNPTVHNNLGNVLLLQGRYREAVGHYRQALQIKPDYQDARFNLEVAQQRLENIRQ